MSQVSMSGSFSLYMQDSEYLKIQAELDREKNNQLTKNQDDAANKNSAANQALLERQLKEREAELDLKQSLQLQETDQKEQRQKEALEAERAQKAKEDIQTGNEDIYATQSTQNAQASSETQGSETEESNGREEAAVKSDDEEQRQLKMDRFEQLQGHMRSLQSMNALGSMFIQKISQTSGEIRTDSDYGYDSYSKSITNKEAARGDLERRKESVDDRAGKTLRDTFNILKEDRMQENKRQNERMSRMQQNLSGLDYAGTAFSHNVNFTF